MTKEKKETKEQRFFKAAITKITCGYMEKHPEVGDIVVCRITKVLNYGVFVNLLEFEEATGFVHISQVSSSWIKNIRNFVKENQIRAAQVVNLERDKNQLDLSFNKVSSEKQRLKIEEFKQFKRTRKLIEILAKNNKAKFEVTWKEVAVPLLEKFDSLYDAFQGILLEQEEVLSYVPANWRKPLFEIVDKNIEIPKKIVKGALTLKSNASDGVELIRTALLSAVKISKDAEIELYYVGGAKYMVKVTSFDYKVAERVLKQVGDAAIESIKTVKGQGSFSRLN